MEHGREEVCDPLLAIGKRNTFWNQQMTNEENKRLYKKGAEQEKGTSHF